MRDMNLFQRMLCVQTDLQTVAKNLTVSTGARSSYKAVGEKDILDAVKPLESTYGIYSYPESREVIDQGEYEKETRDGNKSLSRYLRIKTVYRFINVENPTEQITMESIADGIDPGDKATGKAMTYCDKYALMKAYKISTGEDPDQQASEEYTAKRDGKVRKQDLELLRSMVAEGTFDERKMLDWYKVKDLADLTEAQGKALVTDGLKRRAKQTSQGA